MGLEIWLQGRIVGGRLHVMYGEKYPGISRRDSWEEPTCSYVCFKSLD